MLTRSRVYFPPPHIRTGVIRSPGQVRAGRSVCIITFQPWQLLFSRLHFKEQVMSSLGKDSLNLSSCLLLLKPLTFPTPEILTVFGGFHRFPSSPAKPFSLQHRRSGSFTPDRKSMIFSGLHMPRCQTYPLFFTNHSK